MLPIDKEKINQIINKHTAALVPLLLAEQDKYGMAHSSDGIRKIKAITKKRDAMINKITIRFKKSGIYREKGAGRGYGGEKGSKWINANGEAKTTNPKSLGKAGTGNRSAAPWFNPVVEKYADQLSADLVNEFVEIAFNSLKIK